MQLREHLLRLLEAHKLALHSVLDRQTLENSLSEHEKMVIFQAELNVFGITSTLVFLGQLVEHCLQSKFVCKCDFVHEALHLGLHALYIEC